MSLEGIPQLDGVEFEPDETGPVDEAGSETTTPTPSREAQLQARLEHVESQTQANTALGQLMADPEIRAILEARQSGRKVKVIQDEPGQAEVEIPENLEELPPGKIMELTVARTLQEVGKLLDAKLQPVRQELDGVRGKIQEDLKTGYEAEIRTLSTKYKDFQVLVPDIMKINQSSPGLKLEELYLLAKLRRGEGLGSIREAEEIETERPVPARRSSPASDSRGPNAGHAAFNDALSRALKKTLGRMKPLEIGE